MEELNELRKTVVSVSQDFYQNGLVRNTGTGGNISARDPDSGLIAVTPSQVRYDTMGPEDIVIINLEGDVIEAREGLIPTSESPTHRLIYQEFSQFHAVVHSHSIFATVLGSLFDSIPAMHTEFAAFIGDSVPVAKYAQPGTKKMARVIVEKLRETPAMVLRNHGTVSVAENPKTALDRALAVEDTANMYYHARALGNPKVISPEQCRKLDEG